MKPSHFYPVILAGGSGIRFWPRSRRHAAKQVLNLDGKRTMIQQTVSRLLPLAKSSNIWIITNEHLRKTIAAQLPRLAHGHLIAEPAARNTAPAIGLAAFLLERRDPAAILGMFPADHVIADNSRFRKAVARAIRVAGSGPNIVVMGIPPASPETGYGYIQAGSKTKGGWRVKRFTEKPSLPVARRFLAAGNYFWNSGMFVWSAQTLTTALREHLPRSAGYLEKIAAAYGTKQFGAVFHRLYPLCDNISIDYAVLEPRSARGEKLSHIYCIPADFGWNDLGSWNALYQHRTGGRSEHDNVIESSGSFALDAKGNYLYSPGKFVAAIGVSNLVVVETGDALLVTTREHAQNVGRVVKHLAEKKLGRLL